MYQHKTRTKRLQNVNCEHKTITRFYRRAYDMRPFKTGLNNATLYGKKTRKCNMKP